MIYFKNIFIFVLRLIPRYSPLHVVVTLATKCYAGEQRYWLPEIVQLLIDAGADVTDPGTFKQIPIDCFFDEVFSIISSFLSNYLLT